MILNSCDSVESSDDGHPGPEEPLVAEMAAALRRAGMRTTPQRLATLRALVRSNAAGRHPSAEELYETVRREHPSISQATVYNSVNVLKALGQIWAVGASPIARYEARVREPHAHLMCAACGAVTDLLSRSGAALPRLWKLAQELEREHGYAGVRPRLDYVGHCGRCADTLPASSGREGSSP